MPASVPDRPRALLIAHTCTPYRGSENKVGWNRALGAALHFETTVVCRREMCEPDILHHAAAHGPTPGLRWVFLSHSPLERFVQRFPGGMWTAYSMWQRRAGAFAARLHAEAPFDVVHHVNWVGYREPGDGWRLGAPFVWGPVGGTQNVPPAFLLSGGPAMAVKEGLRSVANAVQLRSRRVRRAARAASPLLVANSTVQADMERVVGVETIRMLETGVDAVGAPRQWAERAPGPVRLLWVGDCLNRKGARLMVRAMERVGAERPGAVHLTVCGDGPERARFARLANCTAEGTRTHAEMPAAYAAADALVFPSLRDTSGNAVLEALAAGLPVICLDHQGVRDIVTPEAGIKVPVTTPAEAVDGLARAIAQVGQDAAAYDAMSRAAVARAAHYGWGRSAEALRQIYLGAMGRAPMPDVPPDADALDELVAPGLASHAGGDGASVSLADLNT